MTLRVSMKLDNNSSGETMTLAGLSISALFTSDIGPYKQWNF